MIAELRSLLHDALILFAMVNVVGNMPIISELSGGISTADRRKTHRIAVLTACGIVVTFALIGHWMLRSVFDIDQAALQVAGGAFVFSVSMRGILNPGASTAAHFGASDNIGIYPLGFPLLAGPGTILTAILLLQHHGAMRTVAAACVVYAAILPLLSLSMLVTRAVGKVGELLLTRILYIFIAAKAVTFVLEGVREIFHLP